MKNVIKKVVAKVKNEAWQIAMLMGAMMCGNTALAGGGAPADPALDKWNAVIGFVTPWIQRMGGVVILIGAIEFGLGFKNDDPEGKVKGMRTIIAGAIVLAVGAGSSIFLV